MALPFSAAQSTFNYLVGQYTIAFALSMKAAEEHDLAEMERQMIIQYKCLIAEVWIQSLMVAGAI